MFGGETYCASFPAPKMLTRHEDAYSMYYVIVPCNQKNLPKGRMFAYLEDPGIFTIYFGMTSTIPDYIHTPFSFLQGGQSPYQIPTSTRLYS